MADGPAGDDGSRALTAADADAAPPTIDHADWHELSVVALLDRDVAEGERAAAERLLATCPTCARLHGDLVALARSVRQSPTVARPRDFSLTVDDATRLRPAATWSGEPRDRATRLGGVKQVPDTDHRTHDPELIAGLLDRSPSNPDRHRAEALITACTDCAALHRDLLALRDATAALPTPPRVRDYAITADDARRLRGAGWRRLIAIFGSGRDGFSRPLAIGLTTIGLAGLLVTTIPWTLPGASTAALAPTVGQAVDGAGAGAGSTTESLGGSREAPGAATAGPSTGPAGPAAAALPAPSAAPSRAAALAPPSAEPAPSGEAFDTFAGGAPASPAPAGIAQPPGDAAQGQNVEKFSSTAVGQDASGADHALVTALAALLLMAGIGLFVLRWAGRRV